MELLSVWNGIPFLRSSLGLIPTSFEIGSSAFQNDFRTSIQKNWLIKLLPAFFCVWSWKTQTGKPLCLFGSYFQPYIFLDISNWTSLMPLVKVWWADHILFPLFKNPKNHYTISVFPSSSLQSSMESSGLFFYQVLIVLKPKLGRSILCSIFCCSYADDWWILWMPESCLVVVVIVVSSMLL